MFEADTKLPFRLLDRRTVDPLAVSVVIPTLNERDNVLRLFDKLAAALAGLEWEAIFVDDGSTDGTVEAVTLLSRTDRRARLISRVGRRGLSSAVIEGMMSSTAPVVAVIDADLQHDERVLPQLVAAVDAGGFDLAVGSRYVVGGSLGDWAGPRERISRVATRLAEVVTKASLADPMSGFFAVRRDKMLAAAPHLSGKGRRVAAGLIKFCLVCSAGAVANVAIAEMLVRSQPWWLAGAAGAIAGSVWNFAMGGIFAWSDRRS